MINKKDSFIKKLEKQKRVEASFDNGTWAPAYGGQTFIQALEQNKINRFN